MNYLKKLQQNIYIKVLIFSLISLSPLLIILLTSLFILYFKNSLSFTSIFALLLFPFSISASFYTIYKYKIKAFLIINGLLSIIIIFFLHRQGIAIIFLYIIPPILFYLFFKQYNLNNIKKIYYIFIIFSMLITITITALFQFTSVNIRLNQFINSTEKLYDNVSEYLKEKDEPAQTLAQIQEMKNVLIYRIEHFYPVIIFFALVFFYILNLFITLISIARFLIKKPIINNLFFIRTPENYIWIFISFWLLVFISLYLKSDISKIIILNIALAISLPYVLEGGLILLYKTMLFKINFFLKFIFLFLIIELILNYILYGLMFFALIGILDYWLDFRKINSNSSKPSQLNNIDTMI